MRKVAFCIALLMPILTFSQGKEIEKESFKERGKLFKGYVALGANFTQIDGDNSAGYNNLGANGGVGAFVMYSEKFSNSLEISYSMRGARRNLFTPQNQPNGSFAYEMDYIEIPLLFNYHDFKIAIFQAGLSYSQIIRNKYTYNGSPVVPEIYNWNMDLVAGVTFLIKGHWGINFKYNYSLLNNRKINGAARGGLIGPQSAGKSQKPANGSGGGGTNWYHNVLTFRLMYVI